MYLPISVDPLRYEPGPPVLPFLTCEQTDRVRVAHHQGERKTEAAAEKERSSSRSQD